VIKKLLAISLTAFIVTACGGGSSGNSGATNTGNTNTGTDNGGGTPEPVDTSNAGGQVGSFGDSADASNGIDAMLPVCPATVTSSFTGFALDGTSWCVWQCPDSNFINDDNDEYGFIEATGETCRVSAQAAGSLVTAPLFAAIDGCPAGGCQDDFPRVFVSANASAAELAGTYTCQTFIFDVDRAVQRWFPQTSPAAFDLTLGADSSATFGGNSTTFTFADGTLTLAGSLTLNNVAVGGTSFTSYNSNTSIVRCEP